MFYYSSFLKANSWMENVHKVVKWKYLFPKYWWSEYLFPKCCRTKMQKSGCKITVLWGRDALFHGRENMEKIVQCFSHMHVPASIVFPRVLGCVPGVKSFHDVSPQFRFFVLAVSFQLLDIFIVSGGGKWPNHRHVSLFGCVNITTHCATIWPFCTAPPGIAMSCWFQITFHILHMHCCEHSQEKRKKTLTKKMCDVFLGSRVPHLWFTGTAPLVHGYRFLVHGYRFRFTGSALSLTGTVFAPVNTFSNC